ncbi:MAG: hypothetical protein K5761_03225, partial [Clostridiales bacterium]|nr:hypothetical protein [Clostridiales bacterium]
MKKTIAFIIAVCMLILMCLPVLAEEAKLTKEDVMKEIEATAAYLLNGKTELTVDDATNLYYLTEQIPDAVTTELIDSFLDSVKQNLEANGNAKITKSDDTESVATYAAVVRILDMYTEDGAENFNGVDVSQLLLNSDLTTISNPYDLTIIIPVMGDYDMDKTKTLCDYYIDNFYTEGQGVDYYGYSCDNTCMFVQAIADSGM